VYKLSRRGAARTQCDNITVPELEMCCSILRFYATLCENLRPFQAASITAIFSFVPKMVP
jgi:hypothetical protein